MTKQVKGEGQGFEFNLMRRQFLTGTATVVSTAVLAPWLPSSAHGNSSFANLDSKTRAEREKQMKQISELVLEWIKRDEQKIVELFSRLVQCPTPSPPGDTREVAKLLKGYLDEQGLAYKEVNFDDTMPNLLSSVEMPNKGRHLMFNGHLDVLPGGDEPGWTDDPWSGKIADGKVWGRGSADMKAGVTAMLFSYAYLAQLRDKLKGKVSIALVSDEETGFGRGAGYMFQKNESEMLADCVLSAEPSGTEAICFASKGYLQFTVRVATPGAIAGYPNESKNSILIASQIIRDLNELQNVKVNLPPALKTMAESPKWRKRHEELMGEGAAELIPLITVDVGVIDGGSSPSVISPDCAFSGSIVIPVGTDPYMVFSKTRDIVSRYSEASLVLETVDSSDYSDPTSEMAVILQETVETLGWLRPEMTPATAVSDCRYWRYRGIPSFWYGPDGSRCSAANEFVSIVELMHIVRTNALAAAQYLLNDPLEDVGAVSLYKDLPVPAPTISSLPVIRVARLTATVASFDVADVEAVLPALFAKLHKSVTKVVVDLGTTSFAHFEKDSTGDGRRLIVSAAYPVGPKVVSGEGFEVVELPAYETAATTVHRGTAHDTRQAWSDLRKWASGKGYKSEGAFREYYVVAEPNPHEIWATELQLPLKR